MSNPQFGALPSDFDHPYCNASFIAADGTKAKVVVFPQAAKAVNQDGGNSPLRYGGCAIVDLTATSSDGTARDFRMWIGTALTTQETTATGTISTTASTIVRANGNWISDGFRPGMRVGCFAPTGVAENAGVDGIFGTITAVTATTLTVDGAPYAVLAALGAGTYICAMNPSFVFAVAINAGNTNAVKNTTVLGNGNDAGLVTDRLTLGPKSLVAVQPLVAVSALPAVISFDAEIARY